MKKSDNTIWVIRAGFKGEIHDLFLERSQIALANQKMGDLRLINGSRDEYYKRFSRLYPDLGRTSVAGIGGKFFRFAKEIKNGDFILYPCRLDGKVHYAEVTSSYCFTKDNFAGHPHRRKVRWLGLFSKDSLSDFARREIGAARTLFKISRNQDEIQKLIAKQ